MTDAPIIQPAPVIDATLSLTAELVAGMWTLYCIPSNGGQRQSLGAGTPGSSIAFPVKLFERYTSEPS